MKTKVALVQMQMSSVYEDNIAKVDSFIEKASKNGAKFILLPELFERHYFCQVENYDYFDLAEEVSSSRTLSHFQKVAKDNHVILPISFFEKDNNCYFNSLALIDEEGKILGVYRKSHIPTGECYEEKFYFTPGDTGFMVFETSIGKIGIGICWDQWFPECARILALKCADLICYPTAIGSEPVLDKDSKDHWQNVMRGHAGANIVPVMAANRIGVEKNGNSSMTFFGSSFISDEYGNKVEEFSREDEGILYHEFDFENIEKERRDWGVFRDRRTDLYSPILKLSDK